MNNEKISVLERQFFSSMPNSKRVNKVIVTNHAVIRSKSRMKRVNKKRLMIEASRAMFYGRSIDEMNSRLLYQQLKDSCVKYGSVGKIYRGYVYWFQDNRLVTLYPVPNRLRHKQRKELCYE